MAFTAVLAAGAKLRASTLSALIIEARSVGANKTSTQNVNNSTTFTNDTEIVVAGVANAVYDCFLHIIYNSSTVADFKTQLSLPAGATAANWSYRAEPGATLLTGIAGASAGIQSGSFGTGADEVLDMWGLVIMSGTAGNIQLQWAQNTLEVSNTAVKAGSYLRMNRIS